MADEKFKTLEELSITGLTLQELGDLAVILGHAGNEKMVQALASSLKYLKDILDNKEKYVSTLEDEIKLVVYLEKLRRQYYPDHRDSQKLLNDFYDERIEKQKKDIEQKRILSELEKAELERTKKRKREYDYLYDTMSGALDRVIRQSEDLFKRSHDLQIQGNLTWSQYTRLYNDSFKAIRDMNTALGQSVFTTRDLFDAQQRLIPKGWKGIEPERIVEISAAVKMIDSTLGTFPEELSTAFQMSFRQFGEQTDRFVYAIGNRLNAFSDSFGVTVGALTGAVTQMMAANTYLARNNMTAQIMASESLMAAVALSSAVGIETSNFMVGLAQTAQFGTAAQMSDLYQTGALLQGFSVGDFQHRMKSQDYMGATMDLIGSIQATLGGMDDGYLKNEYIQRIASGFGLSQNDVIQIMTDDYNLREKALEIQEKLLEADTSMEQELAGLKVALMDRLENWWDSTKLSQGFGKVMQDLGLIGIDKQLRKIQWAILGQSLNQSIWDTMVGSGGIGSTGAGSWGNLFKGFGGTGGAAAEASIIPTSGMPVVAGKSVGQIAGGLGVTAAGMYLGSRAFQSEALPSTQAKILGAIANIGGGMAGGFMVGQIPGMIVGGLIGATKTAFDVMERNASDKKALDAIRDKEIIAKRQSGDLATGDPLLDAIGSLQKTTQQILATVDSGFAMDREIKGEMSMINIATPKGKL